MKIRVMIVEDHSLARLGARAVLEKSDYINVVAEAENGNDAINQVLTAQPDVILMDIGMPVKDGIEATREIKSLHPQVKVIALSSHEDDVDIQRMVAAGANAYCLKAISSEQLVVAIQSVFSGEAWFDSMIASKVFRSACESICNAQHETAYLRNKQALSQREMEVLVAIVDGCSNDEISKRLFISIETVKTHVRHIMEKLDAKDRTQAAVIALREKLVAC
jgi:two-component system, NarL family, response regulator